MKIFVEVWCELDPALNMRLDRTTGEPVPEPGDSLHRVSPAGRSAIEMALGLPHALVVAYAVGEGHRPALRHALAAGAAGAVELLGDTARWLAAEHAELVIAGETAGYIAGVNGWAHVAGVTAVDCYGGKLCTVRSLGRGDREEVEASLPAAIRLCADELSPPRYVARQRVLSVDESAIERDTLAPVDKAPVEMGALEPTRTRARVGAAPAPASMSASGRLAALLGATKKNEVKEKKAATTSEMAEELVRYLAHHELLEDLR